VILKLTIYSAQLCLAVLQYNRLSAPHFFVRSAALHSIKRYHTTTADSLLYLPHFSIWWYNVATDYLLRSTSSGGIRLQVTIYWAPLCLEKLQLTLCYAQSSALRSTLSGETTTDYLLRSTLSSGITLQPTIFCAPTIHWTLLCLARLQLTLLCTLLCRHDYIITDFLLRFILSGETTADYLLYSAPLHSV
jgi:hypothetical protein